MTDLFAVLPNDIDDPAMPSGGNRYDRRVLTGLAALGWSVRELPVRGAWPDPTDDQRADLAETLSAVPDDALVLVDGLVGSAVPEALRPHADRVRLVLLVHMPLLSDAEGAALAAARTIIATSPWTRDRLIDRYGLPTVHVATPGVDPAPIATGTGGTLLCVAAVTRHKGYDLLAEALAKVADLPWRCVWAGTLDREPDFVARLRRQLDADRLTDRVDVVGPLTETELDAAYAAADLLVLPSRGETYGMVVTEALARGVPVLATAVAGLPDALGRAPDGSRPGLLVPPEDPAALAGTLRGWLSEAGLRQELRRSALRRRDTLTGWDVTAGLVAEALGHANGAGA
jgi:glycosyltransferase involved in cell wall biosynthesis